MRSDVNVYLCTLCWHTVRSFYKLVVGLVSCLLGPNGIKLVDTLTVMVIDRGVGHKYVFFREAQPTTRILTTYM